MAVHHYLFSAPCNLPEKAQQAQQLPAAAVVFSNAEYLRPYLNAAYANAGSTNPALSACTEGE
jgi:hypothetical protein